MLCLWAYLWVNYMARSINQLTARSVAGKNKRGRYADGGGLYLQVSDSEAKS